MIRSFFFLPLFGAIMLLCSCTADKPVEKITERYPSGDKKQSLWIYPDGTIKKENTWFINGIKETEVPYKDGVPHGHFRQWTHMGSVILEGEYEKGKREGTWTSKYPDKKKKGELYYKNGHAVGDWLGVHPNGNPAYEEHYSAEGDSIGTWRKWYKNGNPSEENSCFGTVSTGSLKKFRNDGTLEFEKECKNGIFAGRKVHYYSDGKKIRWEEKFETTPFGRPDTSTTLRTFYYGNGSVQKEEQWEGDSRKGVWKWFDPAGNLLKESRVEYDTLGMHNIIEDQRTDYGVCGNPINDTLVQYVVCAESTFSSRPLPWKLHGKLWYYKQGHNLRYEEDWEYGVLKETRSYYLDSLDGNSEGGILASQGYSLDGKRNGIWRNWYKNGVLKDSLSYANGELSGEQFSYDSTGRMTIHKTAGGKNRPIIVHIPE